VHSITHTSTAIKFRRILKNPRFVAGFLFGQNGKDVVVSRAVALFQLPLNQEDSMNQKPSLRGIDAAVVACTEQLIVLLQQSRQLSGAEPEMVFYGLRLEQLSQRFASLAAKMRHPGIDSEKKADTIKKEMAKTTNLINTVCEVIQRVVRDGARPAIYCDLLYIQSETSQAVLDKVGAMTLGALRCGDVRFIRLGLTKLQMIEIRAAAKRVCKDHKLTIRHSP
jgi:hypothetical protein